MKTDYLERILTARVYDVAVETPLELAPALSARLGNTLLLKRFKPSFRRDEPVGPGALVKHSQLAPATGAGD